MEEVALLTLMKMLQMMFLLYVFLYYVGPAKAVRRECLSFANGPMLF